MTAEMLEQRKKDAEKINCFGYRAGDKRCFVLRDVSTSLEQCMKCKFRKPDPQVTDGTRYPRMDYEWPKVILQRGKLKIIYEDGTEEEESQLAPVKTDEAEYINKDCIGCAYSSAVWRDKQKQRAAGLSCTYILATGHRRPCAAGECVKAGVFVPIEKQVRPTGFHKAPLDLHRYDQTASDGRGGGLKEAKPEKGMSIKQNADPTSFLLPDDDDVPYDPLKDPAVLRQIEKHREKRGDEEV